MALLIEYREYTTEGRFISSALYETLPNLVTEDLEVLFETNDLPTRLAVGRIYMQSGVMQAGETLKTLFKTNVTVRDTSTGRFRKWSDF